MFSPFQNNTPYTLPVNYLVHIYTPGNDGICRTPLKTGVEYYLGGISLVAYLLFLVFRGIDQIKFFLEFKPEKLKVFLNHF